MADNKITMQYDLRQNNTTGCASYGKWYAQAVRSATLNTRGLADHIMSHGSIFTRDVVEGMVIKFRECIVELLMQGVGVKLEGLGTFYPTLETTGADEPEGYNIDEHLKGVHIRFRPERASGDNLTSPVFAQKVLMRQRMVIDRRGVPILYKAAPDGQTQEAAPTGGGEKKCLEKKNI